MCNVKCRQSRKNILVQKEVPMCQNFFLTFCNKKYFIFTVKRSILGNRTIFIFSFFLSRFIPAMVAGDRVGAIAMTEPGAGSDLQGIVTRAKLDSSGDYILNGSKVSLSEDRLS